MRGPSTRVARSRDRELPHKFAGHDILLKKGKDMTTGNTGNRARKPIAVGVAAAIALSGAFAFGTAVPVSAAPLSISQTAVKEAAPDNVIDVGRRHRHWHGHAIAGLALGIIGAAIAHRHYKRHHRHYYYYHPHAYHYGFHHHHRRHHHHHHHNHHH